MARLGLSLGKEKAPSTTGLLSTGNVALNKREKRRLGYTARRTSRFVFSWVALTLGLFMAYTSLHYAPALFKPKEVLGVTTHTTSAKKLDPDRHPLTPLTDLFRLKRGYFHAGQTVQAQYKLPDGAEASLTIVQCRRAVILEVFRCDPISRESVVVTDTSGARTFRIGEEGFYFVSETVTTSNEDDPYAVMWQRT